MINKPDRVKFYPRDEKILLTHTFDWNSKFSITPEYREFTDYKCLICGIIIIEEYHNGFNYKADECYTCSEYLMKQIIE